MMMESYLLQFGYALIILGTFFEGETILILAGFLASRGYMNLYLVMLCAFLGTFIADQLYFFIGRKRGMPLLDRSRRWKAKAGRVLSLLKGHEVWMILGFRFVYGVRTVTPFLIGAVGIAPRKFLPLNALGGAAWSFLIALAGYLLGNTAERILSDIKRYELAIIAFILIVSLAGWIVYFIIKRSKE